MQTALFDSTRLTLVEVELDDDTKHTHLKCDVRVQLAGDSIWDCELTDADDVRITSIHISEGVDGGDMDGYRHIAVIYTVNGFDDIEALEGSWRLYTDTGFAECVSELLGERIDFTEQGMQDDGYASME
jgi:hypothetical protein